MRVRYLYVRDSRDSHGGVVDGATLSAGQNRVFFVIGSLALRLAVHSILTKHVI